jgi:hypothetical protein
VLNGALGLSPRSAGKPKRRPLAALHNPACSRLAHGEKRPAPERGGLWSAVSCHRFQCQRSGKPGESLHSQGQARRMWAKIMPSPSGLSPGFADHTGPRAGPPSGERAHAPNRLGTLAEELAGRVNDSGGWRKGDIVLLRRGVRPRRGRPPAAMPRRAESGNSPFRNTSAV